MDSALRFVVPGYGTADADPARAIRFSGDDIRSLREHMGKVVKDLMQFERAYAETDWSSYEQVPTFGAANRCNAIQVDLETESELL